MPERSTSKIDLIIFVAMLLIMAAATLTLGDFFGFDETDAFAIHMVYDEVVPPAGIRATIGYVVDSLLSVIRQTAESGGQPPLYYLLLDGWELILGEAQVMLRMFNVVWGVLLVGLVYRLLTDAQARALIIIVLALSPILHFAMLQQTPLIQFLALAMLSIVLYLRWRESDGLLITAIYTLVLIALVLTAYSGVTIVLVQAIHMVMQPTEGKSNAGKSTRRKLSFRRLLPFIISGLVVLGWIVAFTPSVSTQGSWILILLAILAVVAIPLLLEYGNRRRELLVVTAFMIVMQVVAVVMLGMCVRYTEATQQVIDRRDPFEPLLYDIPESSIMVYYLRQTRLGGGYTLNVGWRDFSAQEMESLTDDLQVTSVIWLIYPSRSPLAQMTNQFAESDYSAVAGDFELRRFRFPLGSD